MALIHLLKMSEDQRRMIKLLTNNKENILINYVREKIEFSFCCLWEIMLQNCSPMRGKSRITAKM